MMRSHAVAISFVLLAGCPSSTSRAPAPPKPAIVATADHVMLAWGTDAGTRVAIDATHAYWLDKKGRWKSTPRAGGVVTTTTPPAELSEAFAVTNEGRYWAVVVGANKEVVFQPKNGDGRVIARVPGPHTPWMILPSEKQIYIGGQDGVFAIELATGAFKSLTTIVPEHLALDSTHVYIAHRKGVSRVPRVGGEVEPLAAEPIGVSNVVVDDRNVYFARRGAQGNFVLVSVLKGGGGESVLATSMGRPVGVTATHVVTVQGSQVLGIPKKGGDPILFDDGWGSIDSAVIDGDRLVFATAAAIREVSLRASRSRVAPMACAVDKPGEPKNVQDIGDRWVHSIASDEGHLYFADGRGEIVAWPKSGKPIVTLAAGQKDPRSIKIDAERVYWVDAQDGVLRAVAKTGGTVGTLASGQGKPIALALDATNVYWATAGSNDDGTIATVAKAGGVDLVLATGLSEPRDLGVTGPHVFWTDAVGLLLRVAKGGGEPEPLGAVSRGRSLVAGDTTVYWGGDDGEVRAFDRNTGSTWRLPEIVGTGTIDGLVLQGDELFALEHTVLDTRILRMLATGSCPKRYLVGTDGFGFAVDASRIYGTEGHKLVTFDR